MNKGIIYILTNPSFPEFVKIGYADDLEKRLAQLNRSETIPFAFRVYAIYEVNNRLTDLKVHNLIDKLNPELRAIDNFNGKERKREFYAMSAEDAYELLDCIAQISGTADKLKRMTPEGHEILDEEIANTIRTERRTPFRFSDVNIPVGSEIVFIDDESIKATVKDDRHIEYQGRITSLSSLAQELKGFDYAVQGTLWFKYNNEILNDIRLRME